jgi:DNA-binding NarL/FixJ family response regulator
LDVCLPDGSGLEILRQARDKAVHLPALIITGILDHDVANAAFELGAKYLVKPVEDTYVESFLYQTAHEAERVSRVPNALADWTARFGLSEAESDILRLSAEGHDRDTIARARGCSELTVKKHISNLLQKTGDSSVRHTVKRLLRETFHNPRGTTP